MDESKKKKKRKEKTMEENKRERARTCPNQRLGAILVSGFRNHVSRMSAARAAHSAHSLAVSLHRKTPRDNVCTDDICVVVLMPKARVPRVSVWAIECVGECVGG